MDMRKLMQQAQQMQQQMLDVQESLKDERVQASAGGGMVEVTSSGTGQLVSLKIDPEAVDTDDMEMLEDMILAAVNEAARQASELSEQRMGDVTGGMGGMPGLPGM